MTTQPEQAFLDALEALRQALDEIGAPWMIIGGVGVIALGIPRLTVDIDATVAAAHLKLAHLVESLGRRGIEPRIPDALAFARAQQAFLGVHAASGTPIDVSLAWLPFEDEALRASQTIDYAGVRIRIARPEDLLIYKLIASRPHDIKDAEGLLLLYGAAMDLARVRETINRFATVLEDAERPRTLEGLISKTGLD